MEYLICIFSGTNFKNCFILGRWYIRLGCIICRFSTKTKYFISNYTSSRKINSVHTYKASKSKRKRIYSSYNFKSQCKRIFTKIYTLPINKLQIESEPHIENGSVYTRNCYVFGSLFLSGTRG